MIIYSNRKHYPFIRRPFQTGERMWVAISWIRDLSDTQITDSEWILPPGFTLISSMRNVVVRDQASGKELEKANRALIQCDIDTDGTFVFENRVTGTGGQILESGFYADVKNISYL